MNDEQRKRHQVRQGLTGLAQVSGRNNISWEKKISYDLEYIENITLLNDLKIIIKTISKVFKRENIQTDGMETAKDYGEDLLDRQMITKIDYDIKIDESINMIKEYRIQKKEKRKRV